MAALSLAGDGAAFGRLVERHQGVVRGFLRRLTQDEALADDLAQEVFLRAFQKIAQYRGAGRFRSWLLGIAYREFAAHHRKQRRWAGLFGGRSARNSWERCEPEPEGETPPLEDVAVDAMLLTRALDQLAGPVREAILLCEVYGFSHGEVAALTGAPLGTVKSHVNRGRKRLMRLLQPQEVLCNE